MKTIIAEKPSVAREIARIVGATKREEGYFEGGGYAVTWAFGHLVQLAMPDGYGVRGFVRDNLPIIPDTFTLVPRQVRTEKGYKPDSGVVSQIKVIKRLFDTSEHIIVATDAGREEKRLIFRHLYHYTGLHHSFRALRSPSLSPTKLSARDQETLRRQQYDNLYLAAKGANPTWPVGINGTQALSIAAGHGTDRACRHQRWLWYVNATGRTAASEAFWAPYRNGRLRRRSREILILEMERERTGDGTIYNKVKAVGCAIVTKAERKEKTEENSPCSTT